MKLSLSGCYGQVASFSELKDVNHPLNQYLLCDDRISSTAVFMCGVACIAQLVI